ncbi:MAG: hypothetical protein ACJ8GO_05410 [Ramlibacter sp.]
MKPWRLIALCLLLLVGGGARAAITCTSITSPGWTAAYVNGTTPSTQGSFTMTCSRGLTTDPTSINYSVTVNNGGNPTGQTNYATLVTTKINYDTFTVSCGNPWKNNTAISGTVTWGATSTGNSSDSRNFWLCVNNAQTLAAQGTYSDTVTMTATYNPGTGNTTVTGAIQVNFYAPAFCNIVTSPGNISLSYPAFSLAAVSSNTSFATQCTSTLPYTLDISPASGTLAGVNYTVGVSQASATGTGLNQPFTITATAPASQPGTCTVATCTNTQTHTLTITY